MTKISRSFRSDLFCVATVPVPKKTASVLGLQHLARQPWPAVGCRTCFPDVELWRTIYFAICSDLKIVYSVVVFCRTRFWFARFSVVLVLIIWFSKCLTVWPQKIAWFRTQEDGWFWLWTLSQSNQNHWNPQQAAASARLQPVKAESPSEDPPCVGRVGHGKKTLWTLHW